MPIKTGKGDVVWGYVGTTLSMGANLVLLPFLLYFMPADYLGLWYVFTSIGALSILFDFGFNPAIARNVAFVWSGAKKIEKEGVRQFDSGDSLAVDFCLFRELHKACRILYAGIALLAFASIGILGTIYVRGLAGNMDLSAVYCAWGIYLAALILNLYYGYYATLLRGVGAVMRYNQILVASRFLQLFLTIVLLLFGFGIIAPAAGYFVYGLFLRVVSKVSLRKYQSIGERLDALNGKASFGDALGILSAMWHNAWRDGLVALSNYLASQATVIVASLWLTLAETGVYSITIQLLTALGTIASVPYSATQPALSSAYVEGRLRYLHEAFAMSMVVYAITYFVGLALLITIGAPLLAVVKPDSSLDQSVLLVFGLYYFFYKRQQLYASYIANMNYLPYVCAYVFSSVVGVVLSVFMVGILHMGVWGLVAGQAIPQVVFNCWRWPLWVHRDMGLAEVAMLRLGLSALLEKAFRKRKRTSK